MAVMALSVPVACKKKVSVGSFAGSDGRQRGVA